MVQDLTFSDIQLYTSSTLRAHPGFQQLECLEGEQAAAFVDQISSKSAGVFLWVRLVVKSILEGLRDGDRLGDLRKRLEELPAELQELFQQILSKIEPRYFRHACELFRIVRAATPPVTVLTLSLADEDQQFVLEAGHVPLTAEQTGYRAAAMQRRLLSRCQGFLEVVSVEVPIYDTPPKIVSRQEPETVNRLGAGNLHQVGNIDGHHQLMDSLSSETQQPDETETVMVRDPSLLGPKLVNFFADARVEYMHRTVKDFLEEPQIWSQIETATDNSFDPNISLIRAFLLRFKTTTSENLFHSADCPWSIISSILKYSSKAGSKTQRTQFELLHELDRFAQEIFSKETTFGAPLLLRYWGGVSSLNYHWSSTLTRGVTNDNFPHLAVRTQLSPLIAYLLRERHVGKKECSSLLKTAVSRFDLHLACADGQTLEWTRPNLELIKILMEGGADPNLLVKEASSLDVVREHLSTEGSAGSGIWQAIASLLQPEGALAARTPLWLSQLPQQDQSTSDMNRGRDLSSFRLHRGNPRNPLWLTNNASTTALQDFDAASTGYEQGPRRPFTIAKIKRLLTSKR